MKTTHINDVCVIAATLLLTAVPALAAKPSGPAGASPPPHSTAAAQRGCVVAPANGHDDERGAPQSWYGAQEQTLPQYLRGWLSEDDKANLESISDPCRLIDMDPQDDTDANAGPDVHKLLGKIDEWMALNQHPARYEEAAPAWRDQRLMFEFEGSDHRMHAVVGNSHIATDHFGATQQQWQALVYHGWDAKTGSLGKLRGKADQNPQSDLTAMQPVPEPDGYAMLLAGLGLLGWAMRRRST